MNEFNYEERAKVYKDALKTFGIGSQLVVAVEELSECQKEICKALRGNCNTVNLVEEVADATIMLEQIRLIYQIDPEVCQAMDAKVDRLRVNIEKTRDDLEKRRHERLDRIARVFKPREEKTPKED